MASKHTRDYVEETGDHVPPFHVPDPQDPRRMIPNPEHTNWLKRKMRWALSNGHGPIRE